MSNDPIRTCVDSRKEVVELLKDLQAQFGAYHNHKESMAWAGVALFAVLMAAVAASIRQSPPLSALSFAARVATSLFVAGACSVCWLYVQQQFALRRRAADLFAACIGLRSQVISEPSRPIVPADWAPPLKQTTAPMQSTHVLPQAVRKSADELATAGQTSRALLERCAYAILLGLAASLLLATWSGG